MHEFVGTLRRMADVDPDCLFCKIVAGEVASTKVYEDEHSYAFADLNPQAPRIVYGAADFSDTENRAYEADAVVRLGLSPKDVR